MLSQGCVLAGFKPCQGYLPVHAAVFTENRGHVLMCTFILKCALVSQLLILEDKSQSQAISTTEGTCLSSVDVIDSENAHFEYQGDLW
jgi:hypothetical protein